MNSVRLLPEQAKESADHRDSTKRAPAHNMSVEEAMKQFPEKVEITRYGRPEEIADLLAFMVSPAAKWMTGTSVRMDGGEIKAV